MKQHKLKVRLLSMLTALTMLASLFGAMPQGASAADTTPIIKLGDYVKLGTYVGSTLSWRCVAFEKATRQADGSIVIDSTETSNTYQAVGNNTGDTGYLPLMLADKAIGNPQKFDAPSNNTSGSHGRYSGRIAWGSNYWGDSDIRSLLKSFISGADSLWRFTDTEKAAMQTVTQKSLLASFDKDISGASGDAVHTYNRNISNVVQNYSSAYSELITDTMFLLDVQQVYNVYKNLGDYYKLSSHYWLRSPYCSSSYSVRCITADGHVGDVGCTTPGGYTPSGDMLYNTNVSGVRPAFFLDMSKLLENPFVGLDGSGTEDEPYTVVHRHVLTYHAKVDATCTSSGTGEYWKCEGAEGCKKYFSDANGENEISSPPYIRPKGHTWSEWVTTKEPTETAKGEKERECSVCHATETKEIAAFNDLNIGDYLEMGTYDTDGDGTAEPILWRCVAFEKATRQSDGSIEIDSTLTNPSYQAVGKNEGDTGYLPLMLADAAIGKTKAFDAKGENTSGSHGRGSGRTTSGSNYWGDANIRDWLNSADKTVAYTCGNAPSRYKDEAGFLTNFNSAEKAAMISVKQKALINSCDWYAVEDRTGSREHTINSSITSVVANYSEAYATHITDTMFLLDVQQLYNVYSKLSSYCTIGTEYWLRSPIYETNYSGRYVSSSSNAVYSAGVTDRKGIRPAFFFDLSSVEFEGGDGAKENPHTIPKPPHYHTLMHYEAVAPTCTASGNSEYWKCEGDEGCGKYFSDENGETEINGVPTVNAAGHSLIKTEAQDATCTAEGNREYWTCSVCGKLFSDENGTTEISEIPTIPTIAHTEETIPAVAATCTKGGKTAGVKCSVCGTVLTAPTETAALGHSWGDWEITKPAAEAEDGEKSRTCSRCNETETQVIPATGHTCNWGDWTITTAPTLTATGKAERVCKTNANHKDSVDLPILTDTTVWTEGARVEPTETTDGSQVYTSEYGNVTLVLPATGIGDTDKFSIRYEGGNAIVTAPTAGTYAVIFAAYDGGRLTSVTVQSVTVEKGETTVEPQGFTANGTVKVMLWESLSGMKPLCTAGE